MDRDWIENRRAEAEGLTILFEADDEDEKWSCLLVTDSHGSLSMRDSDGDKRLDFAAQGAWVALAHAILDHTMAQAMKKHLAGADANGD